MRKNLNLYVNFSKKYDFYLLKYFEYTLASRFFCSGILSLSVRRLNKNKKIFIFSSKNISFSQKG